MFLRSGGGVKRKKNDSVTLPDAISQISSAISSISSRSSPVSPATSSICSPAKSIDSRSKCYKQLGELNNLKLAGVLSEEEFAVEKIAVMDVLKKL